VTAGSLTQAARRCFAEMREYDTVRRTFELTSATVPVRKRPSGRAT
jgi:hypothetical protein